MLCSSEAMVLCDTQDRIIHTNKAYTRMTGYSLSDVEGKNNYTMLQGPLTDVLAVQRCAMICRKQEEVASVTVTNYRKGRLMG
jgi:PAS domain S-box-containing protein